MKEFKELWEVVKYLRSEKGCPWDRAQTSESIAFDLVEEAYEVVDAIKGKNIEKLKEELGDLLFLILLHIEIKEEEKAFSLEEVLRDIKDKMISRHPHVFGDKKFETHEELLNHWEKSKKEGPFKSLPKSLPALLMAQKLIEREKRYEGKEIPCQEIEQWLKNCGEDVHTILLKAVQYSICKGQKLEETFREYITKLIEEKYL
ncbi:MAG: nucleoside triphosphate pyrophosphohydrolase [Candidatus Hydrothermota bacterium]|nr:MAG: nucleoside triphosphate pyrophosphohydrolase [Candidatus Hydrothermae bacterium]